MTDIIDTVQQQEIVDSAGNADTLIELFDISLPGYAPGGTAGNYYLVNGLDDDGTDQVEFGQKNYLAIPIELTGIEAKASGAMARPTLSVANLPVLTKSKDAQETTLEEISSGTIGNLDVPFESNYELIGTRVTYRQVYLSDCNTGTASPAQFPSHTYYVDRIESENAITVTFELASPLDVEGVKIPHRNVIGQYCSWQYQGRALGHGGGCTWRYKEAEQHSFFRSDDTKITGTINAWSSTFGQASNPQGYAPGSIVKTTHGTTGQVQIWEALFQNYNKNPDSQRKYWKRIDLCGKTLNSCKIRFQGASVDISSITKGTTTQITTSSSHGFVAGDIVQINLERGTELATALNGSHRVTSVPSTTQVEISVDTSSISSGTFNSGYISQIDSNTPLPFGGFPGSKKFK